MPTPWQDLQDAYGPATDVPKLLATVARSRGEKLHEAIGTLWEHTCHQGTIYSASPPVVRAIIEFAPDAEPAERAALYGLLQEFASSARKAIADGRAIPCQAGGDPVDGRAIRDAILRAHQQFTRDLAHAEVGIRAGAASLSAAFGETAADVATLVRKRYFVESDVHVRREIILGMIRVQARYDDWPDLLDAAVQYEDDAGNRFFLLQARVVHSAQDATTRTVANLVSTFADFYGKYNQYLGGDVFFDAIGSLGETREVDAMLQALDQVTGRGPSLTLAERLLRLTFRDQRTGWGQTAFSKKEGRNRVEYWGLKGQAPALPDELTTTQSNILQAIAGKATLWQFDTNLWELFGLPQSAAELTRLAIRQQP